MAVWIAEPCGCRQVVYGGQKREKLCGHRNVFESETARASAEARLRAAPQRNSTLSRGKGFAASPEQRTKVEGTVCVGCGRESGGQWVIDPAHLWPRSKGGCDHPDCVFSLCRWIPDGSGCHQLFDRGELDLLERVSERSESFAVELAHPILVHGVTVVELARRLAGNERELVWVEREAA